MTRRAPGKTDSKSSGKKRGLRKLANPTSTGGGGVGYEARVQAVYLLAMFAAWPTAVYPDTEVVELRFQGRIHGYSTDDLVCTLQDVAGSTRKALLQVKLTLQALPSDTPFADAIAAAWYDFLNPALFTRGRDRLVIVYARDADQSVYFANILTRMARTSFDGAELERKATAEGFSSKFQRSAYRSIKSIIGEELERDPDLNELHEFMKHLWFIPHNLADDETPEVADIFGRIKFTLGAGLGTPRSIWSELTTACLRLNKEAASLSFTNLDEQLPTPLSMAFAKHRASAAAKLPVAELASERQQGIDSPARFAPPPAEEVVAFTPAPVKRVAEPVQKLALSVGRDDSADRVITGQLDAINEKLKQCRYEDALEDVLSLGRDLQPFDAHQLARWYLQRGTCYWHLRDTKTAAADLIKAAELYPDDEKMAAAGIRGRLFLEDVAGANEAGKKATERLPSSLVVWLAHANVRINNGETLTIDDAPVAFRKEADTLQLIAASRFQSKDLSGAVELSLQALQAENAGYYTRNYALYYALENATTNKVVSTYKLADNSSKAAVRAVIASFEPHSERLWTVQAPDSIAETVANLGVAHLVVGETEEALRLCKEAQAHGIESPETMRVVLEAYLEADRIPEMLAFGRENIAKLTEGSLVGLAQAAANAGELEPVDEVIAAASRLTLERPDTLEVLRAIRWMALMNIGKRDGVAEEALTADLPSSTSLPLLMAGVRALRKSNRDAAAAAAARAEEVVSSDPTPEHKALLAELLFDMKEFAKAARLYDEVLPRGQLSELHNKLLHSYIRTGNRQQAKALIESFPEGWVNNDDTRALAIELGQEVGDWPLLTKLADAQFSLAPHMVSTWLFKFMVGVRELAAADLRDFLDRAPLELEGSIQQTTQLATVELRYGLHDKGMRRVYRLRRLNAADVESASALMLSFLSAPGLLPNMEETLLVVAPGTHVVLTEEDGRQIHVTVDPPAVGLLPETDEFRHSDAPAIARLLGLKVGEVLGVEGSFRTSRALRVQHVDSAYRRLMTLAQEQIDRSIVPVPNIRTFSIPTKPDGEADFSEVHEQLRQQAAHVKDSFHRYQTMPITLGILCQLIGVSPVDAVRSWPPGEDTPALFVTGGTVEEREKALAQLQDGSAAYVVDAATLTELVRLGIEAALKALPKVYATADTRDLLLRSLEEAKSEPSSGRLFDRDGQLGFVEHSAKDHQLNARQIEQIIEALDNFCEVVPAYGPEQSPEILDQLERALSDEEHAVLRLAIEKRLCLFTVDGRLRNIASLLEVPGVWPQALAMHARDIGLLGQSTYAMAVVRMFLGNRTFVSLSPYDLLLMCHQGSVWAQTGIARYKKYLANPATEFKSGIKTTLDFIAMATTSCTYLGAIAELLRHTVEGLMRHKDHDEKVLDEMESFLVGLFTHSDNPYPGVRKHEAATQGGQIRFLAKAMVEGLAWSKQPMEERPVRLQVHFVGRTPCMVSTTAVALKQESWVEG